LEHLQIHDTGNGLLHEEGAIYSVVTKGEVHAHLRAVTNMLQGDTWFFTVPYPAILSIDLTTAMKLALIAENYGVSCI
jgi:hypothetical protein